nr:uncharacterized protein LOC109148105 [Ipomoea batatas]
MSDAGVPRLGTAIHITALDGIIHVNSLFSLAVFVGLSWNPRDPNNRLTDDPKCLPDPKVAEDLVAFHVYSFACFLFSSHFHLHLRPRPHQQDCAPSRVPGLRCRFGFRLHLLDACFDQCR